MDISFDEKTAIVTGAAHGIGEAITLGLASRGATVWACDILEDALNRMVAAGSATLPPAVPQVRSAGIARRASTTTVCLTVRVMTLSFRRDCWISG